MNHLNIRIRAALLPFIAQEIRTHAGFQKISEKDIATCAEVLPKEEVKAEEDTTELFFLKDVFTGFSCDLRRLLPLQKD